MRLSSASWSSSSLSGSDDADTEGVGERLERRGGGERVECRGIEDPRGPSRRCHGGGALPDRLGELACSTFLLLSVYSRFDGGETSSLSALRLVDTIFMYEEVEAACWQLV